eukprot:scaffold27212_cov59-Phaeocystis_antarctica.AAC.3
MAWGCSPHTSGRRLPQPASQPCCGPPNHAGDPEPELHQKALMVPPACARAQLPNPSPHPTALLTPLLYPITRPY